MAATATCNATPTKSGAFQASDWSQLLTLVELLLDPPLNVHAKSDAKATTATSTANLVETKEDKVEELKDETGTSFVCPSLARIPYSSSICHSFH
jgi:hypothetical protein